MKIKKVYHNPVGVSKFTGLILISPFIIGFVLFTMFPLVQTLTTGLQVHDIKTHTSQYSFDNFISVFKDSSVRKAVSVTLKYTAVLVPLKLIVSLLTALILNMEVKGIRFFRTVFYIPSILGANLAIVIMWQYLFTSKGLINQVLEQIGLSPVSWYGEPGPAMTIIILLRLWEFGSTMVIFLAALRDIPKDYYDAAKVDGCGNIRAFFKITLPMLKNVIFINLVLQTVSAMQEFNAPYMITGGNPMKNTYTIGMLIYDRIFRDQNLEQGYAVSWLLFAAIGLIIGIMFLFNNKYGEDKK